MGKVFMKLINHYYYLTAIILFLIGFYTMLTHSNLIKKIIGMNIMDTAVFLLFISLGYVEGGRAPLHDLTNKSVLYVNPLPTALMLTGIVVAVSITAFALSLSVKLYNYYGTIDMDEITKMRRNFNGN
ncbi:MAG: multicomponent Na+:H+ antiporter subunit [Thermosediminibacterales bacterium]|nr:multicomponent Na+:H+ antiporter subunit [Thermosediminibacterales bacterium]